MDIINLIEEILQITSKFIFSDIFILYLLITIISIHLILFFVRDKNYISALENIKTVEPLSLQDFDNLPTVNIIVPAWKEGEIFNGCLLQISKLSYPNLKVIVNAGGSNETINIANSFKKNDNFTIIYQKTGQGKIKAINDCLRHVSEGIIYLIDADVILTDQIILNILYSLIYENNEVVVARVKPHSSIQNMDLVKYLEINRNIDFLGSFSNKVNYTTQNTGIKHEVIKTIGKFSEGRLSDDGISMGSDILSKGFQIHLIDKKVESFNYPYKIKDYFKQNLRWLENYLYTPYKNRFLKTVKFFGLVLISIYIFISPFLLVFNINLFLIGLVMLLSSYLKRVRKTVFFKMTNSNENIKISTFFYIKLVLYIIIDLLMNIIVFIEIIFYRKAYKKRKNLLQ